MPNDFAAQIEDYGSIVILVIAIIIVHGELFCAFLNERFSVSNIFNLFDFNIRDHPLKTSANFHDF